MEDSASHLIYTPRTLRIYDWFVLGFSNRWIWRCPTRRLLRLYDECVTENHLDVGVGTGYYLHQCRFPKDRPRIVLLDRNPHCLDRASRRIARYQPEAVRADILEPMSLSLELFDSISLNYVLHCLPGAFHEKARVFDHLWPYLHPGGVVFGATLLGGELTEGESFRRTSWGAARWLTRLYNAKQVFDNHSDTAAGLRQELETRCASYRLDVVGCAALFVARKAVE